MTRFHTHPYQDTSVDNSCQFHEQIQLAAPVNQEQVLRAFLVHSFTSLGTQKISYLKQALQVRLQGANYEIMNILGLFIVFRLSSIKIDDVGMEDLYHRSNKAR